MNILRLPLLHSPSFLLTGLLLATSLVPAANALAAPASPPATSYAERAEARAFAAEMAERHDFDAAQLMRIFAEVKPIPAVIKAVMPPKDPQVRSWKNYRDRFVEPFRIETGLDFWLQHEDRLRTASRDSGVPAEYIVAIIGVESIYGRHTGNFNTFAALSTLAFDYPRINPANDARRKALFRGELAALLLLARDSLRDPLDYRGSYAGALGLPQFLPSSIQQFARDGDGDGLIDLHENPADAIASVGNFLKLHGWQAGEPVRLRVALVDNPQQAAAHRQLLDEGILPRRSVDELTRPENHGLRLLDNHDELTSSASATTTYSPSAPAALIDLVTPGQATEYYLGLQNFYVITRYNRSSFYAMAVHELAQALRRAYHGASHGKAQAAQATAGRP